MDEFRRAYEYEDDDNKVSGLLLLFFIMVLICETVLGIMIFVQLYDAFGSSDIVTMGIVGLAVLYTAYMLFVCFSLQKLKKHTLKIVKSYLMIRVGVLMASSIVLLVNELDKGNFVGGSLFEYSSAQDAVFRVLIFPGVYFIAFSTAWYLYFLKSKRVKNMYGKQSA